MRLALKLLFIGLLSSLLFACGAGKKISQPPTPVVVPPEPIPEEPVVEIETNLGSIEVKLFKTTPQHRDNFVRLLRKDYYDSLLFHRVIPNFMIQGGDPDSRNAKEDKILGRGGPKYQLEAELLTDHVHIKGALAAAREGDAINPEKKSSGSQFYIVQGDKVTDEMLDRQELAKNFKYSASQREDYKKYGGSPHLDGDYTVFGQVTKGFEVVDKISALSRNKYDRPKTDVWMKLRLLKTD